MTGPHPDVVDQHGADPTNSVPGPSAEASGVTGVAEVTEVTGTRGTTASTRHSASLPPGFGALPGTARVEAFSDGVFAIAITLLVIEIHVPEDMAHLPAELAALWSSYLAYGVSFLLIGLVWANHHVMFEHIERADRTILLLNTLLLGNVAFLPFVAAVLAAAFRADEGQRAAVVLYGATLVLGGVFFNAIWEYARRGHRLLGGSIDADGARSVARRFLLGPALYAAATVVGAVAPTAGVVLFAALILFYWLPVPTHSARSPHVRRAGAVGAER